MLTSDLDDGTKRLLRRAMNLIALYKGWHGQPLAPGGGDRMAAALATFTALRPVHHDHAGATLACASAQRGWRALRAPDGRAVMFCGRISNRSELRSALDLPASSSDVAIYAEGLSRWGCAVDLKIIGEYCAVLVGEHRVDMVRSPFGAPPLHYFNSADHLIAATTPRAIFATGLVRQELDEIKIADSLMLNYNEGSRSWFKSIRRVPLGTRLTIIASGTAADQFYRLDEAPQITLSSDDDYVEALEALMHDALAAATQDRARPAVAMSGGLDSQAVACFALERGLDVRGYTSVPEPGWDGQVQSSRFGDERAHVEAFAAMHPRFKPTWIDAAGLSFDHKLQALFMAGSITPRNSANLTWIHELSARAKADGCDVLLHGGSGNGSFSFGGEGALPGWLRSGQWLRLGREVRARQTMRSGFARTMMREAVMPLLPRTIWFAIANRKGQLSGRVNSWSPINPDWAASMDVAARSQALGFDTDHRSPPSCMAARQIMLSNSTNERGDIELAFHLIHNIERRDALRYRPLIEFCAGIPDDQYLRNGETRWLARRLLRGRVPEMVRQERRRGLQLADWHLRMTRERDALLNEVESLARDPVMASRLDLAGIKATLEDWPAVTPVGRDQLFRARLAVSRGLTTARFIRYVEGRNDC